MEGDGMDRIEIGRYQNDVGWRGWISTPDWIIFERPGELVLYCREEDGAVKGAPTIFNY